MEQEHRGLKNGISMMDLLNLDAVATSRLS